MITPLKGFRVDPNNPNGVVRDTGVDKSMPAVVTSTSTAEKTTRNMAELTSATTPKIPVPQYGQKITDSMGRVGLAKFDPNTGLPLDTPAPEQKPSTKPSPIDAAIGKELGVPTTTTEVKSQTQIDAEVGLASDRENLLTLQKTMDSRAASMIQNIITEYDSLTKQQEVQNKAYEGGISIEGSRSGRERYAPVMQAGIISSVVSEGLGRISTIQAKKQSLILQAESARDERNFKALNSSMQEYREIIKEERSIAQETMKAALQANKEARERAEASKREVTIADYFSSGVTDPAEILRGLSAEGINTTAKEVDTALKAFAKETGVPPHIDKLTGDAGNFFIMKGMPGSLPSSITSLPDNQQLGAYIKWNQALTTSQKVKDIGNGVGTFDQFKAENVALAVIPGHLRNSVAESERYLTGIRLGLKQGLTPYEVGDALIGYNINKPDRFSDTIRQKYIPLANLGIDEIRDTARLINAGSKDGVVTLIENKVLERQRKADPDGFTGESIPVYYATKIAGLRKEIEDAGIDVGPVTGTLTSILGKAALLKRADQAKIQAQVTSLVSEMRNQLAGTAVTESEKKFLDPLIPSVKDKERIAILKIDEIGSNSLQRYNATRSSAGLPQLTGDTLVSKKARSGIYENLPVDMNNSIDTEDDAVEEISKFYSSSPKNASLVEQLQSLAPNATPEEIRQQLGL